MWPQLALLWQQLRSGSSWVHFQPPSSLDPTWVTTVPHLTDRATKHFPKGNCDRNHTSHNIWAFKNIFSSKWPQALHFFFQIYWISEKTILDFISDKWPSVNTENVLTVAWNIWITSGNLIIEISRARGAFPVLWMHFSLFCKEPTLSCGSVPSCVCPALKIGWTVSPFHYSLDKDSAFKYNVMQIYIE